MNINKINRGLNSDGDWIFKCDSNYDYQTGYEDVMSELTQFDCEDFKDKYTELEKEKIVDKLFELYRDINIFPIKYYSMRGIENEIVQIIYLLSFLSQALYIYP